MLKEWKDGLYTIRREDLKSLRSKGYVLQAHAPDAEEDMRGMQRVLRLLHGLKSTFSFEIWSGEETAFCFSSRSRKAIRYLGEQLESAYPDVRLGQPRQRFPSPEGNLSACTFGLKGQELNLRCPEDFSSEPLANLLSSLGKGVFQVTFKPTKVPRGKREAVVQKYGNLFSEDSIPLYKCFLRMACFDGRERCELAARSLPVLGTDKAELKPDFVSFPFLTSSFSVLRDMAERRMPLFSGFLMSVPELTSLVHLPGGVGSE